MHVLRIRVGWLSCRRGRLALLLTLALFFALNPAPSTAQARLPFPWDCSVRACDDSYAPTIQTELTPRQAGQVLRVEHFLSYTPEEVAKAAGLPSSPYGAEVYGILYMSRAPARVPRVVSGLIVVPTGPVPEKGFPIIAHGHATTGLADVCAPSRYPRRVRDLLVWVSSGYLVSATDYVGLGTPALHPYLVGEAEAFSMLDGAWAALQLREGAYGIEVPVANQIILEGHSQGGHAALFAHQHWIGYAPELNILGTVAFAPASEFRFVAERMAEGRSSLVGMGALAMYSYSEYYGAPADIRTWLKEPYAAELPGRVEEECVVRLGLWLGRRPFKVFQRDLLEAAREGRWDDLQPWTAYMDINSPGSFTSDVPVFLLQGEDDRLVPPEASELLKERLCAHGTPVKLSLYADTGHGAVTRVGHSEVLQWIAERLTGLPVPDDCSEFLPGESVPRS